MPLSTSTFPRSEVLVLSSNSVQSLVPATLISQAESLLESHRIEDAISLADQQRKRIYGITVNEDEVEELRYVYQRIGFQCFAETLFEDAGRNFFNGDLDPRLLVSYYPELRGSLFTAEDTMDVYAGVAERMPVEASVDDIIRNYSPHLSPNTRSAPPTAELRKILNATAMEMLESFLRKCRTKRKVDGPSQVPGSEAIYAVVDTVFVKLLAQAEKTKELYAVLQDSNNVVVSEVEEVLSKTGQYNALCMLYKKHGEVDKLLNAWSKVIEGEWLDEDIEDPTADLIGLLTEKRDRALTQKWGLWLTKRDPERGLKLLMPRDGGKRRDRPEEDKALLEQIKDANPAAAVQFLEYLILQRRSASKDIHMQYAMTCVDQLLTFLSQEHVSKLWRAKASSYSSSRTEAANSFISYFASTTPDSEHKRVRLKTLLFLQGSSLYDAQGIRDRLQDHEKILKLEMAIVEGKLKAHRSALSCLVNDLHDTMSAEAYCALGGDVIPSKTALSIIENTDGLQAWKSTILFTSAVSKTEDGLKRELLKVLLQVYMDNAASSSSKAAQLLNSQAVNLDMVDVVSIVPPTWPIQLMSSFLSRSFRRTLHQRHEGQIVKAIAAGQNLEVKDKTWLILREEDMLLEEAVPDDGEHADEKGVLNEKAALHMDVDSTVDISPPETPSISQDDVSSEVSDVR